MVHSWAKIVTPMDFSTPTRGNWHFIYLGVMHYGFFIGNRGVFRGFLNELGVVTSQYIVKHDYGLFEGLQ